MNTPAKQLAEKLLKQGIQQLEANDIQAAIASWQQALTLYQQLRLYYDKRPTLSDSLRAIAARLRQRPLHFYQYGAAIDHPGTIYPTARPEGKSRSPV